jgi:hypothetical protein
MTLWSLYDREQHDVSTFRILQKSIYDSDCIEPPPVEMEDTAFTNNRLGDVSRKIHVGFIYLATLHVSRIGSYYTLRCIDRRCVVFRFHLGFGKKYTSSLGS